MRRPAFAFPFALALLFAGLPLAGRVSAQPADDTPSPAESPLTAEFGKGAEDVAARLKDLERSLADQAIIDGLAAEVATLTRRTAAQWHEMSRLLARNLRTTALDSLTTYWTALHADLDDLESRIDARVRKRDGELTAVASLHKSWTHALEIALGAAAPPVALERVRSTIAAIEEVKPHLEQRRARLLVMQSAVSRAFQHCADAVARIGDARHEAIARMFTRQEPPIWQPAAADAEKPRTRAPLHADLDRQRDNVRMYLETYRIGLWSSLGIIAMLAMLVRWANRRLAGPSGDPGSRPAFPTPFASAFLAGLLLTVPLRPTAPYEFQQAMLSLVLIAAGSVFRPVVSARVRAGFYAACGVFVVNVVSQILEPRPRIEQILLIGQMAAMAGLLVWTPRQTASAPSTDSGIALPRSLMHGLTDVLAIGCAVSAIAAALGYLDLADLLGIGLMLTFLLSVALVAVRFALDDVVGVALGHGPLARLHTVRRYRAAIRRGVRAALDAFIVVLWAWLVLGRFQLRDPLLEAAQAVLDTTLRAGGLELPIGHVLAFAAVLASVYVATRLIVVVLEEDVFRRMTLPRGVPYALTTLTRYTLLLAGFLLALGALGLDLTRITVLVSALGLGLGFGLQQIMNNFVSGLILLFERPVQVGDSIQMDGLAGDVLRIGIRSSTVRTSQGAEVIVPNSKIIEEKVTNWTLSDRKRRCDLAVSVPIAPGSDVVSVMAMIEDAARGHPKVCATPAPKALLVRLGRQANHFQLRFWTEEPSWIQVWSDVSIALSSTLRDVRTADPAGPPPRRRGT